MSVERDVFFPPIGEAGHDREDPVSFFAEQYGHTLVAQGEYTQEDGTRMHLATYEVPVVGRTQDDRLYAAMFPLRAKQAGYEEAFSPVPVRIELVNAETGAADIPVTVIQYHVGKPL